MALNTTLLRAALDRCADPEVEWQQVSYHACFAAQVALAAGWTRHHDNPVTSTFVDPDGTTYFSPFAAQFLLTGEAENESFRLGHGVRRTKAECACGEADCCYSGANAERDLFAGGNTLPELIQIVNALDPEGVVRLASATPQYDQDRVTVLAA